MVAAGLLAMMSPALASALDIPPLRSDETPEFVAEVAMSLKAQGSPGMTVSVSLTSTEFQWIRVPDGFGAGFEISVSFRDRSGDHRTFGDSWQRHLLASTFEQTTRPSSITERRTVDVPPGRYDLKVRVRDLESEMESSAHERVEVPDESKVPIGLAELELGVAAGDAGFAPVPNRQYGLNTARFAARATVIDRRSGAWPRTYRFRYRILDDSGNEIAAGNRALSLATSPGTVVVRPDSAELFVGDYSFELELQDERARWKASRTFEVVESGPPSPRDFQRMLEPLSYIAAPDEIQRLRSLPPEQQSQGWESFWKQRDPTADTARNEALIEFLRRVKYADQHFRDIGPGWRSDMGRIYIKFGPPDQVDTRPATSQSPPLEIWSYSRNQRRFVFADREGFGRYVLVSSGE